MTNAASSSRKCCGRTGRTERATERFDQQFWRRWLLIGAAYGIFAGISLVLAALSREASEFLLWSVFLDQAENAGPITIGARQAIAVSGALTAGWGAIAWCLCPGAVPEPAADRRAGRALTVGIALWFVLDSVVSVGMGAAANVIGNISFVVALLPPSIAMARRRLD